MSNPSLRILLGAIGAGVGAGVALVLDPHRSDLSVGLGGGLGFLVGWLTGYVVHGRLRIDSQHVAGRLHRVWYEIVGILCLLGAGIAASKLIGRPMATNLGLLFVCVFFTCTGALTLLLARGDFSKAKISAALSLLFAVGAAYVAISTTDRSLRLVSLIGVILCLGCAFVYWRRPNWFAHHS